MRLRFEHGRRDELKTLHPAYFAMVMATGIVSIAAHLHDVPVLPTVLVWLNALFLAALVAATVTRILRYPQAFAADIQSHTRGVGFFTTVAATAVFGTQLLLLIDAAAVAAVFWIAAATLWAVVTYGELTVLTVKPDKPSLAEGLNGGWLVSVVAAQSVAVLTVLIPAAGIFVSLQRPLLFMALVLWLGAGALYLWLMTLIFYRYTFVHMAPEDLTPPYWINMGAVAISTLAGATLAEHAALSPVISEIIPFVKGLSLFFWAIATWVDPDARGAWDIALSHARCAVCLRSALLGRRLSIGDVFGRDVSTHEDPGGAVPDGAVAGVHDHRARRLVSDPARLPRHAAQARATVGLKRLGGQTAEPAKLAPRQRRTRFARGARRPIERLSANQWSIERGDERGGPDPSKDGKAADRMKVTHKRPLLSRCELCTRVGRRGRDGRRTLISNATENRG